MSAFRPASRFAIVVMLTPLIMTAGPALAVTCDVTFIAASKSNVASLDTALKDLEKKLSKPPFSSWNVFKVLAQSGKSLTTNKPVEFPATDGVKLAVTLKSVLKSKKPSFELALHLTDTAGKTLTQTKATVEEKDAFLLSQAKSGNAGRIEAVRCTQ